MNKIYEPPSELLEAGEKLLFPKYAEVNKATPEAANTPAKNTRMNKFKCLVHGDSFSLFSNAVIFESLSSDSSEEAVTESVKFGDAEHFKFIFLFLTGIQTLVR